MNRETYERQKAFAGEKKASMNRRFVGHDYTERMMYMVTVVVEDRRPLLGTVVGRADAPADSDEAPRTVLSELGQRVSEEWLGIPRYYPQVEVIALQVMPDHIHGILFIKEKMEKDLSRIIRGFKTGCNRHYRELFPAVEAVATQSQQTGQGAQQTGQGAQQAGRGAPMVQFVATESQQTGQAAQQTGRAAQQTGQGAQQAGRAAPTKGRRDDRSRGLLFARGFNDKLLLREGQLQRWLDYLHDNPRRLLMKRERPEWLRPFFGLQIGRYCCSAIGNRDLLAAPCRRAVRVSRRLTEAEIGAVMAQYLEEARQGTVLVSPAISPGEKRVMRAAFDAGLPTIVIMENGFTTLSKPHGEQFDACAEGRLLMLSPWEHHNERRRLTAAQCTQMNLLALEICE